MKRVVVAMVVMVMAACTNTHSTTDAGCGTSAPMLAGCVTRGLAGLDLSGTWTLAGTQTSMEGSAAPITMGIQRSVSFTESSCTANASTTTAALALDDTNAFEGMSMTEEHEPCALYTIASSIAVCGAGDGTLRYHSNDTLRPPPGNPMGLCSSSETDIIGTLTR